MGASKYGVMGKTYRLVLDDDGRGVARVIEFEASGADSALFQADRFCGGRTAELFEDGRSLGKLRNAANGGFWVLGAATAGAQGRRGEGAAGLPGDEPAPGIHYV